MLKENIKTLRKKKGMTQDELAMHCHVVRQTISKWEKGLSVPDAQMLVLLADLFEVSAADLLGSRLTDEKDENEMALQLSRINEQLMHKNQRNRLIWKMILMIIGGLIAVNLILVLLGGWTFNNFNSNNGREVTTAVSFRF